MKRVVVAGAGGFIGGHLVKALRGEGFEVRAVDKKPLNHGIRLRKKLTIWCLTSQAGKIVIRQ